MTLLARARKLAGPDRGWQLIETLPAVEDWKFLGWQGGEYPGFYVVHVAWWEGDNYEKPVFWDGEYRRDITHWMPLPEPPSALNP